MGRIKMKGGRYLAATLVALFAGLVTGNAANAGSFQVNPVNIELPPDRAATSLSIKNTGDVPVSVRVKTYRWTQQKGQDVYSDSSDVIVSPPIFTVPASGTQLVRVGLRTRTAGAAYRVILEEIPRPVPGKINIALQLNLPFYVLRKDGGRPEVSWSAWQNGKGETVLEGINRGSLHSRVAGIDALDVSGSKIILPKTIGVILPASTRQWNIGKRPDIRPGMPLKLRIRNPGGETQSNVVVDKR